MGASNETTFPFYGGLSVAQLALAMSFVGLIGVVVIVDWPLIAIFL